MYHMHVHTRHAYAGIQAWSTCLCDNAQDVPKYSMCMFQIGSMYSNRTEQYCHVALRVCQCVQTESDLLRQLLCTGKLRLKK